VLLVEDDDTMRRIFADVLRDAGYDVVDVPAPRDALDRIAQQSPTFDLVITDNRLPGITGLELIGRLHRQAPALPILCVTGAIPEELAAAPADPLVRWLSKPIMPDALVAAVQAAIGSP
jgi:CheY-like chemotaxis protein